jgi:hypothetical protein
VSVNACKHQGSPVTLRNDIHLSYTSSGAGHKLLYLVHRINAVSSLGVNVYNILVTISCDTELVVLERRFC